jgi:hypothetical protein
MRLSVHGGVAPQSGSFSRHARAGGHPAFSAKHFWIPAFAGMTSLEWKNSPTPQLYKY